MKRSATLALTLAIVAIGAVSAEARGWNRSATTTGPNGGVWHSSGSGNCGGGSCSSSQSWSGPRGNSASRSGSTTCAGGSCNGSATYTGPQGKTVTRSRSFSRY